MYDLLLKNAKIINHDGSFMGNIAVSDGKIKDICDVTITQEAKEVYDLAEKFVIPGVIDTHVHIGWPDWDWEESCVATTKAAAAGGVTTAMIFTGASSGGGAETAITGIDESRGIADEVNEKRAIFEKCAYVDGSFHGVLYSFNQIKEVIPMATNGGVSSFKLFMVQRADQVSGPWDGVDDGTLYCAFKEIEKLKSPGIVMTHCENIELSQRIKEAIGDNVEGLFWNDARPNFVEIESIKKAIVYAKETGAPLYIVHLSTKEAGEELLKAKIDGVTVYGETCPHYLGLNVETADRFDSKVNPPVRTSEDSEALWQAIRDGLIISIGSDHADCAKKHKTGFWSGIVGLPGVQTLLPTILSEGVSKGRITMEQAVAITSFNQAKLFGLYPKKGAIQIGADADLVVVDMDIEKTVTAADMHYISDFTPYEGKKYKGWPIMTFLRGKLVAKDNKITGEKGYGKFIERNTVLK